MMDSTLVSSFPRAGQFAHCTKNTCPIQDSVYGYYSSKVATLIFVALIVISLICHLYQGIRWRSWTFLIALGIGTFDEAVGMIKPRIPQTSTANNMQDILDVSDFEATLSANQCKALKIRFHSHCNFDLRK